MIKAYMELPEHYDVCDIDISRVRLNGESPAESHPTKIGDYNKGSILDSIIWFDKKEVRTLLSAGENTLTITGELTERYSKAVT